ncbi:hypothetical protein [Leuconostoc pseudomesenteroides]|uniref:Uncharacterized protein n=1 Tax=Leuconostoc pseudomesenteroides TaxID=33968 RepID=A0A5B8T0R9_LEUPS|nr:hypothetical protein [Leuconostoc pseudomesenteroides]MCC8439517.1 hypothetical protein [Leuconostoc pseudomesenteroides]MDG9733598.1 hypothetical protein [Leuconostoc pseudomesenteroides]NKZ35966.1 hypothetical protein [Leuconostoc pseudomesenteroides]QEA42546.1 hypothetical protein FGL85_08570 [Leuconostoc pseudomesenteroides]QQB26569.1 hypothetical protein I6H60_05685 [Leuconostoc pseudomesenteroides]
MIKHREVEEFELLLAEAIFLIENKHNTKYSKTFPDEIAAALLSGTGVGAIGVGAVFYAFSGMSGAEIMTALAGFGIGGAALGITSVVTAVLLPVVLVSGGVYTISNQKKLRRILYRHIKESYKIQSKLEHDNREIAVALLQGIKDYRNNLCSKHRVLR